jgi:dTDP-glucose 4,6-dehydratase
MNVRDWCYVEDNCVGVDMVLRNGAIGEIYNIGGGNEVPNRYLTDSILEILGYDESMIDYVEDRLGHDRRYSIDISKAQALGWAPTRDFREALEATVAWYRDNVTWWEPLKRRTA